MCWSLCITGSTPVTRLVRVAAWARAASDTCEPKSRASVPTAKADSTTWYRCRLYWALRKGESERVTHFFGAQLAPEVVYILYRGLHRF
eukprot:12387648-Alexandrium_andersonii.AAC.1